MGLTSSTVTRAPDEYIFVSDDPVPSMWYPLSVLSVFSLNACAVDQFYYTCMDSRDFSCKTDSTRRNRQMYT